MENFENNILVLGKTGVGKTALINYLFDLHLASGAGLPKTEYGIHKNQGTYDGKTYNVYDSWGLEANFASRWNEVLKKQLFNREEYHIVDIKQWFHTVIYCFSGKSGRIEDYEVQEIIIPILKSGCKVIIAFTNTEANAKTEVKVKEMREHLLKGIQKVVKNFSEEDIINISSVAGETFAGDKIEQFGKEEVFKIINRNFAEDVLRRWPHMSRNNILFKMIAWRERSLILIKESNIGSFSSKKIDEMEKNINDDLENTYSAIDADAVKIKNQMEMYYNNFYIDRNTTDCISFSTRYTYCKPQIKVNNNKGKGRIKAVYNTLKSAFQNRITVKQEFSGEVLKIYKEVTESIREV